jgi:hypothetical protein
VHHDALPLALALDPDAPRGALVHVARDLHADLRLYIARVLVENPSAQRSREVLMLLAGLPKEYHHRGGDEPNERVRARARELLAALGGV